MIKENNLHQLKAPTPDSERKYRVGSTFSSKGKDFARMLTYVDARYVQDTLDRVIGIGNWDNEYFEIKGNLFCRITIRYEATDGSIKEAFKMDCGTESNVEKQKGEASDAFKRCAVHFGIARDLYSIPNSKDYLVELVNGKAPYGWTPSKSPKATAIKEVKPEVKPEAKEMPKVEDKPNGEAKISNPVTFGKHNGTDWKDVPEGYLEWICTKGSVDWQVDLGLKEAKVRGLDFGPVKKKEDFDFGIPK